MAPENLSSYGDMKIKRLEIMVLQLSKLPISIFSLPEIVTDMKIPQ